MDPGDFLARKSGRNVELQVQRETQSQKIRRVMEKDNGHWFQVSAHTCMGFFSVHLHTIHNTYIQIK